MAIVSDTAKVKKAKLSLLTMIINAINCGLFGGVAIVDYMSGSLHYLVRMPIAVIFFGVVLIYAYQLWDFMGSIAPEGEGRTGYAKSRAPQS